MHPKNSKVKGHTQKKINNEIELRFESGDILIPAAKGINILRNGNRLNTLSGLNHKIRFIQSIELVDLSI